VASAKSTRAVRSRKRTSVRFGPTPDVRHTGFTLNVSPRGLAISSQTVLVPGSGLHLTLVVTSGRAVRIEGFVVWAQRGLANASIPGNMGIAITWAEEEFFNWVLGLSPPPGQAPLKIEPLKQPREERSNVTRTRAPDVDVLAPPDKDAPLALGGPLPGRYVLLVDRDLGFSDNASGSIVSETLPEFLRLVSAGRPGDKPASPASTITTPYAGPREEWLRPPDDEAPTVSSRQIFTGLAERAPRFFEPLPVRFGVGVMTDSSGFTLNLSRTGLALPASAGVAPGEHVVFAITTRDGRVVRGAGEVVWSQRPIQGQPSMGLRITTVDPKYHLLLDDIAQQL
jgi:hypothetical protein